MKGVRLTHDQKEMVRESIKDKEKLRECIKKLLSEVKDQKKSDPVLLRKIESIAPLYDSHDFWDNQPVPKAYDKVDPSMYDKQIDIDKTVEDVKQDPYNLPTGFYWANVNINDPVEAKEVYDLLVQHYVEDDDNMFRFDYSIEFLQWALSPPGHF